VTLSEAVEIVDRMSLEDLEDLNDQESEAIVRLLGVCKPLARLQEAL
jgi:hypothetical protein